VELQPSSYSVSFSELLPFLFIPYEFICSVFLNLNPTKTKSFKETIAEFDFIGLFLFIGGVVLLLIGFNNSQNSWSDAETVSLLVIGVAMLVAGSVNEIYTKKSPIIPPRLFQTRTTTGILILTFLHGELKQILRTFGLHLLTI
jgi:hypothetical protein